MRKTASNVNSTFGFIKALFFATLKNVIYKMCNVQCDQPKMFNVQWVGKS